nr:methyltransferase domain-containing protein [Wenjunlia tyrosinilytica]
MLVPLYDAVYQRLDVGPDSRVLGLGCGSGLALLMAAARGASVTGVEDEPERLALARERLLPAEAAPGGTIPRLSPRTRSRMSAVAALVPSVPSRPLGRAPCDPYNVITVFDDLCTLAEPERLLSAAARLAERGSPVVLAGWGPPERCRTGQVLRLAARLAEPTQGYAACDPFRLSGPDDLEDIAVRAGLRPDGSGRVACPFAYPDMDSAVRGLCSTGLFDAAVEATDPTQVEKELTEALHCFRLSDGSIRMDNVFRYVIARTA